MAPGKRKRRHLYNYTEVPTKLVSVLCLVTGVLSGVLKQKVCTLHSALKQVLMFWKGEQTSNYSKGISVTVPSTAPLRDLLNLVLSPCSHFGCRAFCICLFS